MFILFSIKSICIVHGPNQEPIWAPALMFPCSKGWLTVGMEIEHNNKWVCMEKTGDNDYSINGVGEMQFPKRFRLTSISGEQLVSTVPGIKNDENIPTDIQYSDFNPSKKYSYCFN